MALGFGAAVVVAAWLLVPWGVADGVTPASASDVFSAAEIDRAESFAFVSRAWSWPGLAITLLAYALLATRRGTRAVVGRLPGPWWVRSALAVAVVSLVVRVVTLPTAIGGYRHRVAHGLSTQTWGGWLRDVAVGLAFDVVVTSLVVVGLIGLVRRLPRAWPAVAGVVAAGFVVVGSLAYPVVVEPLFNSFEPLPDGPVRQGVLDLAEREGVEVGDVLVADASRRTTTLNAYVSGIGATKRVVLYDTLLTEADKGGSAQDEVMVIVAHELAHAKNHDVLVGTALGALGVGAGVGALGLVLGRRQRPGPELVPALLAAYVLAVQVSNPLTNTVSRHLEARADLVSLEVTDAPDAFIAMQRRLALRSLADPTPPRVTQWLWGSHPTVLERIGMAQEVEESRTS